MKLEVLISTMFDKVDSNFFVKRNIIGNCLVINQNDVEENIVAINQNKIISTKSRGLSVSRNIALHNSEADICLICDNDIIMNINYEKIILDSYAELKDADVITFLITMGNESSDRVCSKNIKKHDKMSILHIGSNEITFKRQSLIDKKISFNEKFGLGSGVFVSGEESLLLKNCLDKGLIIYHVPIVISNHIEELGSNSKWGRELIIAKGGFFRAFSKNLWWLFLLYLYFSKKDIIDSEVSFIDYLKYCIEGKNKYDEISK